MVIGGSLRSSLAYLATLGPIGHLRPAPGTIGSVVGVVSGYMIAGYGTGILAAATLLVTIIGIFAADAYSQTIDRKDAPEVIIDEVAGQWIALIILPLDLWWFAAAFVLFRFLTLPRLALLAWPSSFRAVLALWPMILSPAYWPPFACGAQGKYFSAFQFNFGGEAQ